MQYWGHTYTKSMFLVYLDLLRTDVLYFIWQAPIPTHPLVLWYSRLQVAFALGPSLPLGSSSPLRPLDFIPFSTQGSQASQLG